MLADRMRMAEGRTKKLPIDSYVKTLLHMDGAQGSTVFTDKLGRVWTPSAGVIISTEQSKFGGASAYFNGTSGFLQTPDAADLAPVNNTYTFDFWFRTTRNNVIQYFAAQAPFNPDNSNVAYALMLYNGKIGLFRRTGSDAYSALIGVTQVAVNTWYHFEVDVVGTNIYLFLNGVLEKTGTQYDNTPNSTAPFCIGRNGIDQYDASLYQGWIDEFRFSNGIARHTANFVPPTMPYV